MEKHLRKFHLLCMQISSLYLKKISICRNNPKKSSTTKISKHTAPGYSLFTHCSFDATKKNLVITEVLIVWQSFVKI